MSASGVGREGEREQTIDDVSKRSDDIKTGVENLSREEPGGSLPTGQAVSGMKVARARPGLQCGTWEPASRYSGPAGGQVLARGWSQERAVQVAETTRA